MIKSLEFQGTCNLINMHKTPTHILLSNKTLQFPNKSHPLFSYMSEKFNNQVVPMHPSELPVKYFSSALCLFINNQLFFPNTHTYYKLVIKIIGLSFSTIIHKKFNSTHFVTIFIVHYIHIPFPFFYIVIYCHFNHM